MNDKEKKKEPINLTPVPLMVSKVIFDEATGTVTMKLASEEEIAEHERLKAERLKREREENNEQT